MFSDEQKKKIQAFIEKRQNFTLKERLAYELELFGDAVDDSLDDKDEDYALFFYTHLVKITKTFKEILKEESEKK